MQVCKKLCKKQSYSEPGISFDAICAISFPCANIIHMLSLLAIKFWHFRHATGIGHIKTDGAADASDPRPTLSQGGQPRPLLQRQRHQLHGRTSGAALHPAGQLPRRPPRRRLHARRRCSSGPGCPPCERVGRGSLA